MTIFEEIQEERDRQDVKWGVQSHPIIQPQLHENYKELAEMSKQWCYYAKKEGRLTWKMILEEEVNEVFAEETVERQREELIQVAAVVVAMIEDLDSREK